MKVIVAITTYNLKDFIERAVNSVINQKTNFKYQIIISDDNSSDGTVEILKNYKNNFPDLIKLILNDRNNGSLKNSNLIFNKMNCKYFSFLDGDDFWFDDYRLQKQVDFLDNNPKYSMCAGNTKYVINGIESQELIRKNNLNKTYFFKDYLKGKMPFFHTSSILVRNTIFCNNLPKEFINTIGTFEECAVRGEDFRRLIHLINGPLYAMDEMFSAYRIHDKGMWQGSTTIKRIIESSISTYFYYKYFTKYKKYFKKRALKSYRNLMINLFINKKNMSQNKLDILDLRNLMDYIFEISNSNVIKNKSKINMLLITISLRLLIK